MSKNRLQMQKKQAGEMEQIARELNRERDAAYHLAYKMDMLQSNIIVATRFSSGDTLITYLQTARRDMLDIHLKFLDSVTNFTRLYERTYADSPTDVSALRSRALQVMERGQGDIMPYLDAINSAINSRGDKRELIELAKREAPEFGDFVRSMWENVRSVGRPSSGMGESRIWFAEKAIALKPSYKTSWIVGEQIYEELRNTPNPQLTDEQRTTLHILKAWFPLNKDNKKGLGQYVRNEVSDYKAFRGERRLNSSGV